jgi:multicomponent Na+:H+ antiporter subunit B
MSPRARGFVFGVGSAGFAALLVWGFAGLPSFGDFHGRYGQLLAHLTVPARKATEAVGVTTFDFRGFDTLGEEFILFTAAVGVLVLLRLLRGEEAVSAEQEERGVPAGRSGSLRSLAVALVGPVLVLAIYIVVHGHLTPGGGFQGGVILMTGLLLIHIGGTHLRLGRWRPVSAMELSEGMGAAGFAMIGLGGLVIAGGAYLENLLPLGSFKTLASTGQIPVVNLCTALEVSAAFVLLFAEFLEEVMSERARSGVR